MALQLYKIGSAEVGSAGAANIDFTSIPQGYTDLKLTISARTNRASVADYLLISFNGLTTSFTNKIIDGDGTTVRTDTTARAITVATAATATANTFGNIEVYIPNYTSSNSKLFINDGVSENNATTSYINLNTVIWANSAAINQITLVPNAGTLFSQYTTATLYGIL